MKSLQSGAFRASYSIHELMEAIVIILNARDPYTFEHSWRVSAMCETIVSHMNIPRQWEEILHIAAHLHDIGKIGVPNLILNKSEKLTSAEYEMIKAHPEIGYGIVNSIPQLEEIALYVRHHHERWDGKGYPRGLKGKDIPFGARIIAVADTFDAITSSRPYREKQKYENAFIEINKVSGTQLCPEVCSVFLDIRMEIINILDGVNQEIKSRTIA